MAISFVGASAIWGLIYAYDDPASHPDRSAQRDLDDARRRPAVTWLNTSTFRLNSLLMMVILIWLQVGFAMILLSSAIKGVPEETLEAARIDGASELQIFCRVVVPQIMGTIITVFITVVIMVLKVFDIVYVLTNGNFKSNVIANLFFNKLFADNQAGQACAIVVVLLIAVTPVLDLPGAALPSRGGGTMSQQTAVADRDPAAKAPKRPGGSKLMADGRPRSMFAIVMMILLCVLWTIPTLGLLVTSFRTRDDAGDTGWWTALLTRSSRLDDRQLQGRVQRHGRHGQRVPQQHPGRDPGHGHPDHVRGVRGLRVHVHGLPRQGHPVHHDRGR